MDKHGVRFAVHAEKVPAIIKSEKTINAPLTKPQCFFLLGTWDHSEGQTVSSVSASTLVHKSLSCWGETAVHGVPSRAYPRLH
jgi:hypothetical protein